MKSIYQTNFNNQKVLVRVDFNVPLSSDKKVTDNSRIVAAKKTIDKITNDGGTAILMSHLGRPKCKDPELSLMHIVKPVEDVLGKPVIFLKETIGKETQQVVENSLPGQIILLENLRYHKEEEEGNNDFAQELSRLGDSYVNDAFGTAHRAHASTSIVANYFAENKFAGDLLLKEVDSIKKVIEEGKKPVLAILGGAKVSSKITIINNIIDKIDKLIIGGGMAFTFIKAQGGKIGASICHNQALNSFSLY